MTKRKRVTVSAILLGAATLAFVPVAGFSQNAAEPEGAIRRATKTEHGDGTMSAAAAASIAKGALPSGPADVAAKAAADRASLNLLRSGTLRRSSASDLATAGGVGEASPNIAIFDGKRIEGMSAVEVQHKTRAPDATGAVNASRYIQLVNSGAAIYNKSSGALIMQGTLNDLADNASSVDSFHPQIFWDQGTGRFFYVMDSVFSASSNKLSWGFSKTDTPNDLSGDWCHYTYNYGSKFPDFPRLGNSGINRDSDNHLLNQGFILIGANIYSDTNTKDANFVRSDLIAIVKPDAGTTCPAANSFVTTRKMNLKDALKKQVFGPTPSVQLEDNKKGKGYVIARQLLLPGSAFVFYTVSADKNGVPVIEDPRPVAVQSFFVPPSAQQPPLDPNNINDVRFLDTGDARTIQAVQAINPNPARPPKTFSFWTAHTVASGTVSQFSGVRWYEFDPEPAQPVLLASGLIQAGNSFIYNGAVSPDRCATCTSKGKFGDTMVIQYNASSFVNLIPPRIVSSATLHGATKLSVLKIKSSPTPYIDKSCQERGSICNWGRQAGLIADPAADKTKDTGVVWGTNEYVSGSPEPKKNNVTWNTFIFALQP